MKTSLHWLNSYLDQPVTHQQAEHLLTEQGMPFDAVEPLPGEHTDHDWMLDVEVTSNRSDCLSHVGLARELAAGAGRTLNFPDCDPPQNLDAPPVESLTTIENHNESACPLYTARVIRGVTIAPSPAWLVKRLEAIGLRSVNNVVDVTNFVMMELGQPLHAFDINRLNDRRIVVRNARTGEPFEAIDGTRHELSEEMLVIADADRPVAVAGVMGGLNCEVQDNTGTILLESAIFDPLSVRRTSRTLKLASDSSYRFERGVDPLGVETASRRAAKLIVELAGGEVAKGVIRLGIDPPTRHQVRMRVARCHAILGLDIPADRMLDILRRLDLQPSLTHDENEITCQIPTFRLDLEREIDLIEEVARIHGYDHLAVRDRIHIEAQPVQPQVAARQKIGQVLAAHGYHETISFSFIRPTLGEPFLPRNEKPLLIDDERRKAEPMLRPSLVPSLLACRKANQDAGNSNIRLYEVAATYTRQGDRICERNRMALLRDVETDPEHALRDVRGTIEELFAFLGGDAVSITARPAEHPAFSIAATLERDGHVVGVAGVLNTHTRQRFGLQSIAVLAEMDLAQLMGLYPPQRQVQPLPRFPAIERDLSIVIAEAVTWRDILEQIHQTAPALLEELVFLGVYRGKPIPKGQKSISFRMLFRDPERTLRHEEVDPQVQSVMQRLTETLGAVLRA